LRIEKNNDAALLSILGNTPVEEVEKRIANNHFAFIAFINNEPAAFGWMATAKAKIGELNHEFVLPENNRYLWNFRTLAPFRGLGIYPALLQFIIRYEGGSEKQFWIIHAPENKSSLKGIDKAGFEYVGKLYAKSDGAIGLKIDGHTELYQDLLQQMRFNPSNGAAASCWNCNSPYLKKRTPSCCCSTEELVCTGDSRILLAP